MSRPSTDLRRSEERVQQVERLRRYARILDDGIRIPGTGIRIGLDPILGLIPGAGDVAGAVLSGAIVLESMRQGITRYTLLRMAANIVIDTVLGAFPVLGDLFDAAFKSNRRNLELLERHAAIPPASERADRTFVLLVGGGLLLFCVAVAAGALWLAAKVVGVLLGTG